MKGNNLRSLLWISGVVFSVLGMTACDLADQGLKEKAKIESETAAENQLKVEKKYLEERSKEMESDLSKRQLFYSAVSGIFEGTMKGSDPKEEFKVRFTFTPSLPPYRATRIRSLEEIASDLNNLYFNVQVIQWAEDGTNSNTLAFGCVFQNVRPDLLTGQMNLVASDCPSIYSLSLADDAEIPTPPTYNQIRESSSAIAAAILDERQKTVSSVKGLRQVTRSSTFFHFAAKRME